MIAAPLLFAGLLFISLPHVVQAQRAPGLAPGPAPVLWQRVPVAAASVEPLGGFLGPGDQDHRYEGFFVGAGLGIATTVFSLGLCDGDSPCDRADALRMGLLMTGVFSLGGAVLGGLLPKAAEP